jgi:TolB-like protein/DNA-binding winged helix-turn-helix (wHTH) protein
MGYIWPGMERSPSTTLRIGEWSVKPTSGEISRGRETLRMEARNMRLLLCLAERAGEVVSIDELLSQVWSGVVVTPDSVYQAVASLRRTLGDDPKQPSYIATVPRLGYRMVATVDRLEDLAVANPTHASPRPLSRFRIFLTVGAVLLVGCALFYVFALRDARHSAISSVAVLPFLDLTAGMKEEEFADGMTEELIDKLSKVQGLRVPAPTASFYFKGKQITVADIAKSLGVAYVLDGSVRKSGAMLRVAARLIRADNGYIVWSESYDRPFEDKLKVQDEIAGEVTKALRITIN